MAHQRLYKLTGYDPDKGSMSDDSLAPKPGLVVDDNTFSDPDYEDITTIVNVDKYAKVGLQYIQIRGVLQTLVVAITGPSYANWNDLSSEEKLIAAKYVLAPYALRVSVISDDQDLEFFKVLLEQTAGYKKDILYGRRRVVEEMRQYIGLGVYRKEILSKADIDDIYYTTNGILDSYIASNNPAFKYWLNNTVGTPYETNGFAQKSYYTADIKDALNKIMLFDY